ncbi:MAG: hypothetical protein A2X08_03385 [Bacteroidetes bacterium GWA2_32_17]|nr:MAG: hypothetical protein A2X08_03385 [Bacteroidetes bacterium GWA2_32_17]
MLKKNLLKPILFVLFICYFLPFSILAQGTYQAYFGNLHSHTSNSDGMNEPEDAYYYARYTAGLDFLAVTDHVEQIDFLEWYYNKDEADNATINGTFVGIAGWEWGSPIYGHINVFNTTNIIDDIGSLWYYEDFPAFINWLLSNSPAIAQFNHPGDDVYVNNWNDFEYINTSTDVVFPLIEFQNVQQATDWYEFALAKGWHLSPVWNQDNHSADWGTKNDGRAGVWAATLSRSSLFEAINAGRTYATMDKNAKIWIELNGIPMGSQQPIQSSMLLHLFLTDVDNESWTSIELVTKNGVLMNIGTYNGNLDTTFTLNLTNDEWVFVRAIQADSDYLWSAPVYVTGTISNLSNTIHEKSIQLFPNPAKDYFVINTGEENSCVMIYNVMGKLVYENSFQKSLKVNSKVLAAGSYFVNITVSNLNYTKNIIIRDF